MCDGLLYLTMSFRLFQSILAMSLTLSSLGTLYRNSGLSIGIRSVGDFGRRTNTSSARRISGTPNKPFQSLWVSACLRGIQGSQYGSLKRLYCFHVSSFSSLISKLIGNGEHLVEDSLLEVSESVTLLTMFTQWLRVPPS